MSRPWKKWSGPWTAAKCAEFASWFAALLEFDVAAPYCRPAKDPLGRDGIVLEWSLFHRQVELYLTRAGDASIVRRDGAADFRPLPRLSDAVDRTRDALVWMENRRLECPPRK